MGSAIVERSQLLHGMSDFPGSLRPPLKRGKKAQLNSSKVTSPWYRKERKTGAIALNKESGALRKTSLA